mmetsp:Transcript_1987/g.3218  ORF Transcript_1987/g.3218 Transcript_1987/m.3218 type:complete len:434 (+) Transcript_1987:250-1551(+)|eukprot:CAMPEP_0197080202 /NCGR_PEP_ID=MMETSP1384-20130603/214010_1 /TAXON_ID=29189 /ORGANISM="Ammonia sp." /LENGTH=433 /DNA_ID=CAMNT_0042519083 /DNA_START=189 /DNA_END=1490 /DNA_ORIENTATION=-
MGNCCQSERDVDNSAFEDGPSNESNSSETDGNGKEKKHGLPSPVARKIDAKKQRRRLSVAPEQVGDISKLQAVQKSRRFSAVSAQHIPQQEPKKFVAISKKGYVPYNKNKVNQDSYFCDYNFDGKDNCRLFGVCDGHGEYGHNVSALVARKLPKYLKTFNYEQEPEEAIKSAVAKVVETLRKSNINTTFSGTTLVFSLMVNGTVYTGNVGDSRAIVVSRNAESGELTAKPLSIDHKLDIAEEEERVIQSGGRVAPLPGPVGEDPGPRRVWLADIDVPGLAMSRSLGDDVAHSVGVSSEPQIMAHTLDAEGDIFLVYASDGIWEFLENEQVANLIYDKLPDLREAALKLVKEAIVRWRDEEEVIDDITAVIYNLSQENAKANQQEQQEEEEESARIQSQPIQKQQQQEEEEQEEEPPQEAQPPQQQQQEEEEEQ